jgi:hypothetical protein
MDDKIKFHLIKITGRLIISFIFISNIDESEPYSNMLLCAFAISLFISVLSVHYNDENSEFLLRVLVMTFTILGFKLFILTQGDFILDITKSLLYSNALLGALDFMAYAIKIPIVFFMNSEPSSPQGGGENSSGGNPSSSGNPSGGGNNSGGSGRDPRDRENNKRGDGENTQASSSSANATTVNTTNENTTTTVNTSNHISPNLYLNNNNNLNLGNRNNNGINNWENNLIKPTYSRLISNLWTENHLPPIRSVRCHANIFYNIKISDLSDQEKFRQTFNEICTPNQRLPIDFIYTDKMKSEYSIFKSKINYHLNNSDSLVNMFKAESYGVQSFANLAKHTNQFHIEEYKEHVRDFTYDLKQLAASARN